MATKYYCDRCGKEIPIHKLNTVYLGDTGEADSKLDICDSCLKRIKLFAKGAKGFTND